MEMKIAVCDDSLKDREAIKKWFNKNKPEIKRDNIVEFSCGEDLLKYLNNNLIDIVFLDCQMKGMDGIATAQQLRGKTSDAVIILVSNYPQYAVYGYEWDVFRYILKCDFHKRALDVFEDALLRVGRGEKDFFWIKIWGTQKKLHIEDIVHIESQRNKVIITLRNDKTYSQKTKLDTMAEKLDGRGFIRCHQSYLVNSRYIRQLEKTYIELEKGGNIPVSRDYHKSAYDALSKLVSEGK